MSAMRLEAKNSIDRLIGSLALHFFRDKAAYYKTLNGSMQNVRMAIDSC